ncbi:DUF3017 domain-containing protein [Streptomyces sp. CAU 1734]|uniref:DUF3017 domain-containing protein n=1 Tax=Streptomyces sp. CAU 1734 TaxID=3140360 RepID=UPI00326130A1
MGVLMNDDREVEGDRPATGGPRAGRAAGSPEDPASAGGAGRSDGGASADAASPDAVKASADGEHASPDGEHASPDGENVSPDEGKAAPDAEKPASDAGKPDSGAERAASGAGKPAPDSESAEDSRHGDDTSDGESPAGATPAAGSRRPPTMTTDTARPEGGGRAAPGDAPAPARQWPLLTVLGITALGLLIVGVNPFPQAFRVGTLLIGAALITGAVMRRVLPSVGMLAVRSRFTDMITYGLLGVAISLLALVAQPGPWLDLPFVEELVRSIMGRPPVVQP